MATINLDFISGLSFAECTGAIALFVTAIVCHFVKLRDVARVALSCAISLLLAGLLGWLIFNHVGASLRPLIGGPDQIDWIYPIVRFGGDGIVLAIVTYAIAVATQSPYKESDSVDDDVEKTSMMPLILGVGTLVGFFALYCAEIMVGVTLWAVFQVAAWAVFVGVFVAMVVSSTFFSRMRSGDSFMDNPSYTSILSLAAQGIAFFWTLLLVLYPIFQLLSPTSGGNISVTSTQTAYAAISFTLAFGGAFLAVAITMCVDRGSFGKILAVPSAVAATHAGMRRQANQAVRAARALARREDFETAGGLVHRMPRGQARP